MNEIIISLISNESFLAFFSFVFSAALFSFVTGFFISLVISLFYKSIIRQK